MRQKIKTKILALALVVALLGLQILQTTWAIWAIATEAPTTVATKYFYNQLEEGNETKFYQTMETMLRKGFFKKGDVSVEVSGIVMPRNEKGQESEQLLLQQAGAARDAFLQDYPDLFYVDFDYLSLKIATDQNGAKHYYIGTGRGANYINQDFLTEDGKVDEAKISKAIKTVDARIDAVVKSVADFPNREEQVRAAYRAVVMASEYKLEYQASHPASVRTVYGVFGLGDVNNSGNAVCEGFARAFKTILDRLGIPAILVRGVYMNNGKAQEHMWNYVQMEDGKWYGFDATFDNNDAAEANSVISYNNFYMTGVDMDNYYPTGIISTSDKEFVYPGLEGGVTSETVFADSSEMEEDSIVYNQDGIKVEYLSRQKVEVQPGKYETWQKAFKISYNGKNYTDAAKEGKYIIVDSWQVKENAETGGLDNLPTGWLYINGVGPYDGIYEDVEDGTLVKMDNLYAFKVGVSITGQKEEPSMDNLWNNYYEGKESNIKWQSGAIATGNEVGRYPQPFVKRTSPAITEKHLVGRTYHVTVEYDQKMKLVGELGYKVLLYDRVSGYKQANQEMMKYKIENLTFDGDRTISYDFTPSKLYALDETAYIVQFTGIEGTLSNMAPNTVGYVVYNATTGCIYQLRAMGIDMEAYGKPSLMDDFELSDILEGDVFEGMSQEELNELLGKYGDLLKHRVSLITTKPTPDDEIDLKELLDEQLDEEGRKLNDATNKTTVEMYNIMLSLCWCQLARLKDGTKLRIKLGFPEGYSYESLGDVTFKAYHYALQDDGTYKIEPIECTVTELGLIIEVDSFSPFAIAVVDAEDDDPVQSFVQFETTDGGKIMVVDEEGNEVQADGIFQLDDESKEFTVVADEGYQIESLTIDGEAVDFKNGSSEPVTRYTFTASVGSKVVATFVAIEQGPMIGVDEIESYPDDTTTEEDDPTTIPDQPGGQPSGPNESNGNSIDSVEQTLANPDTGVNTKVNAMSAVIDNRSYIALVTILSALAGIGIVIKNRKTE